MLLNWYQDSRTAATRPNPIFPRIAEIKRMHSRPPANVGQKDKPAAGGQTGFWRPGPLPCTVSAAPPEDMLGGGIAGWAGGGFSYSLGVVPFRSDKQLTVYITAATAVLIPTPEGSSPMQLKSYLCIYQIEILKKFPSRFSRWTC